MSKSGKVASVNISRRVGTPKIPVKEILIDSKGVIRDAHRGINHRQVSMLAAERIASFSQGIGRAIGYGEFAENITVSGLALDDVRLFDMFKIGRAELVVSQIGKVCHGDSCAIFREVGKCVMPREGIFLRVIRGGRIKPGDVVEHSRRRLRIAIITLSDRASKGVYEDQSGPAVKSVLSGFFPGIGWEADYDETIIPDDARRLEKSIRGYLASGKNVIVTTGGTGITVRDITPDVIRPMLDTEIPGIMESIRVKFGKDFPNAVLSRSIAGLIGKTLVYVLPGSPKAAREYAEEIVKTMEHCILMVSDLSKDGHG